MKKEVLLDKVLGSLVGFAIGDAMGATTEFMTVEAIVKKYGKVSTIMGGGWLNLEAGEVTDDTQMMLCVADAYNLALDSAATEHPVSFESLCCSKFSEWYMTSPKDIGNACRIMIASCFGEAPDKWIETAEELNYKHPSLGNGALMRCLYPAIIGNEEAAIAQGILTHNNSKSNQCISAYCRLLNKFLYSTVTKNPTRSLSLIDPKGTAEATFNNAVYWAHKESFTQAILGAVNHGGDADTIAALTGGLAGARFGLHKIPEEWVSKLDKVVHYKLTMLATRAAEIILQTTEEENI